MGTPIQASTYEALTAAGFQPAQIRALDEVINANRKEVLEVVEQKLGNKVGTPELLQLDLRLAQSEARLTGEIQDVKADLLRWFITTQVAMAGLVIAAIKLL